MKIKPSTLEQLEARKLFAVGGSYAAPITPRVVINENPAWKLNGGSNIDLPYVRDSTNGSTGSDTFTKTLTTTAAMAGKELYLHFDGAYLTTSLTIDGNVVPLNAATGQTSHKGGFQAFDFDITAAMGANGTSHTAVVTVNSNNDSATSPASGGDYYRQGGIYRDVTLVAVNPVQVAVNQTIGHTGLSGADTVSQISSPGVRFSNDDVVIGAAGTTIHATTVLDNLLGTAKNVAVTTYLVDAAGVIRGQAYTNVTLPAGANGFEVLQNANVSKPHLWDGRIDPYLYTLYTEVHDGASYKLLDLQKQSVGIRTLKILPFASTNNNNATLASNTTSTPPVMLNGHVYRIVGADMHQDTGLLDARGNPAGWERNDAQAMADVQLLADMGGTAIRTSHYQDSPGFYAAADKLGVLVYTEMNINGSVQASDSYIANAEDQFQELVRQNYNHPSIFAWGFGNETGDSATLLNISKQFQKIAKGTTITNNTTGVKTVVLAAGDPTPLDPNRYTSWAQGGGSGPNYTDNGNGTSSPNNSNAVADLLGTHPYVFWYGGQSNPGGTILQPQGVTEYGGGGAPYQYTDNTINLPVGSQSGGVDTNYHPENQQALLEQIQFTELSHLTLWGQFTWQFFDHPDGKTEGDITHTNDKGLVTRDRVPKDSYYFYKAALNDPTRNYNNQRVLKLSDQYWTARNSNTPAITVYSNIGVPTLTVNGVARAMTQLVDHDSVNNIDITIPNTYTFKLTAGTALAVGDNAINISATYGGKSYTDSAVWSYRNAIAGAQTARIDFGQSGATPATGYTLDSAGAYGVHSGQTFGWLAAGGNVSGVGGTFITGTTSLTKDGVNLNYDLLTRKSSVWEYALANGTYDVRIGAGQSGTSDGVNNFALEGKTAAIDTNGFGQDTFFSRVAVKDGKLTLAAAPGAVSARITFIDINLVSANAEKPLVSNVIVNNGAAQRSSINALSVQFSKSVTLGAGALSLSLRGTATTFGLTPTTTDNGTTYNLTLSNAAALTSLADGIYDLKVDNTKVADSTNALNVMASPLTFTFHRLFGDSNGDRTVDSVDTQAFNLAKNSISTSSNYRAYFDYDNDGDIDALDSGRYNQHIGMSEIY